MALFLMASIGLSACGEDESTPPIAPIVLGALIPLTGDSSSTGQSIAAALEVALQDANDYLAHIGSRIRINVIVEDTQTDPGLALEKLKSLVNRGINVIIGPETSAEVVAVKTYADQNGVLLLSPSSSAPSLAIAGDNLFRFIPTDIYQIEVLTRWLWTKQGIEVVIPMWRDDLWGNDFVQYTDPAFEYFGGTTIDGERYDPDTEDFSAELNSLNTKVEQAVAHYGEGVVAVLLAAFSEVVSIFDQAQKYSALSAVKWYGTDGTALNQALIGNEQAAEFSVNAGGFQSTIFGAAETQFRDTVSAKIQAKIGRPPDSYGLAAYDILMVLTRAYLEASGRDLDTLKLMIRQVAENYFGTTGWCGLDDAGDREFAIYDIWAVTGDSGSYEWQLIGRRMPLPRM